MTVNFKPRITWPKNELLIPAELFGISVPSGLSSFDVRYPNIVGAVEMERLAKGSNTTSSGGLATVEGCVTSDPKVAFANPAKQWKKTPLMAPAAGQKEHGPWQFQFLGGDVFLDLELGIYLEKAVDYNPNDDLSVQIFATAYDHELLHVLDAIDIVTKWLPAHLLKESNIDKYFVRAEPYVYGTQSSTDTETDFAEFIGKVIITDIKNFWITESNRRGRLRDDPKEYAIVSDKINDLRAKQINRPHAR